jgi:hypothetical protein
MSLTNTELLVRSFKETTNLRIESSDIEVIDEETLDNLLDSLRIAISVASARNQEQRDLLRRRLLNSTLYTGTSHTPQNSTAELTTGIVAQESTSQLEDPILSSDSISGPQVLVPSQHNIISGHV